MKTRHEKSILHAEINNRAWEIIYARKWFNTRKKDTEFMKAFLIARQKKVLIYPSDRSVKSKGILMRKCIFFVK